MNHAYTQAPSLGRRHCRAARQAERRTIGRVARWDVKRSGRYRCRPYMIGVRQRGFSLVELMVSVAIGLLLLMGLSTVFVGSSRNFSETQKSARQIENGRYAMDLLSEDIRHAGFYGEYSWFGIAPTTAPPDVCTTDVTLLVTVLPVPIQGLDGTDTTPSCVPDRVAGTDMLVIRRSHTTTIPAANAVANGYYTQTSYCSSELPAFQLARSGFSMMTSTCDAATRSPIRQFHTSIYFISPCSLPSGSTGNCASNPNAPRVPTLERMELGIGGFTITPLVEGIENMQLEYGVDANNDGSPDSYTVRPDNTGTAWASVSAIRIHLLARNLETTAAFTDVKTYKMGTIASNDVTPADSYKRHEYVGLVRVLNMSQRKETPL